MYHLLSVAPIGMTQPLTLFIEKAAFGTLYAFFDSHMPYILSNVTHLAFIESF